MQTKLPPQALAEPKFCPFCGCDKVGFRNCWSGLRSDDAPTNIVDLDEYQCEGACEGRSFWS